MHVSRRWIWIGSLSVLGLLIVAGIVLASLWAVYRSTSTYTITYRVTGTPASANVSYSYGTLTRTVMAKEHVSLPWEIELTADSFLHRTYASMRASGAASDQLTCEVWIDGRLAETTSGAAAVDCGYDLERNPLP